MIEVSVYSIIPLLGVLSLGLAVTLDWHERRERKSR
jgi:hypothetical protein